jgi:prolipoprotein diacylglyceryl transferase
MEQFLKDPVSTLISFSGLSFYGGLIFGCVAVLLYSHHKKISLLHALDIAAPAILIGYAIGRLGCQLSGDGCWGIVNVRPQPEWLGFLPGWTWSFQFPHNVVNAGIPIAGCAGTHCNILPLPVFPTSLYESFMALIALIILWTIRKKISTPGWLFAIFLLYYSTSRFLIEFIRVNPKYSFLGMNLSQAQYISVICFMLGVASFWYFRRLRKRKETSSSFCEPRNHSASFIFSGSDHLSIRGKYILYRYFHQYVWPAWIFRFAGANYRCNRIINTTVSSGITIFVNDIEIDKPLNTYHMSKGQDVKKSVKKEPTKTLKEKRQEKKEKKEKKSKY